jgi:hypothetical protein
LQQVKIFGLSVNVIAINAKIVAAVGNLLRRIVPRKLEFLFQEQEPKVVVVHASSPRLIESRII